MNTKELGYIGENVACRFMEKKGYTIITRNYQRKWGEVDIIAKKGETFHFCEVKSMNMSSADRYRTHRPEDNVHRHKTQRIRRMIETYLSDIGQGMETAFEFHVLSIYIDLPTRSSKVYWLRNVII